MHIVDHIFILILFVVLPIHSVRSMRRWIALLEAGEPADRVNIYKSIIVTEWAAFAVLLLTWYFLDRSIANLGFEWPRGTAFWIGAGLLALATAYLIYTWRSVFNLSRAKIDKELEAVGKLIPFLPHSKRDYKYFVGVSITAGIVEEAIYRGFVIWYMASLMPIWAAVGVASIAFGLGHTYQGTNGVVRVTLLGLVFGAFYILTGSIWLAIVGHAILDLQQGAVLREMLSRRPNAQDSISALESTR